MRIDGFDDAADGFADFAEGLRDVADNIDGAIDEGVKTTAFQIEGTAKRKAPVDTGALRASIEARRLDIGAWVVGAKTEYAAAVELGTAPHVITPTDGEFLYFEGKDGHLIRKRSVQHPGQEAQPYLRPAFRAHASDLTQNISDEIKRLFARFL